MGCSIGLRVVIDQIDGGAVDDVGPVDVQPCRSQVVQGRGEVVGRHDDPIRGGGDPGVVRHDGPVFDRIDAPSACRVGSLGNGEVEAVLGEVAVERQDDSHPPRVDRVPKNSRVTVGPVCRHCEERPRGLSKQCDSGPIRDADHSIRCLHHVRRADRDPRIGRLAGTDLGHGDASELGCHDGCRRCHDLWSNRRSRGSGAAGGKRFRIRLPLLARLGAELRSQQRQYLPLTMLTGGSRGGRACVNSLALAEGVAQVQTVSARL